MNTHCLIDIESFDRIQMNDSFDDLFSFLRTIHWISLCTVLMYLSFIYTIHKTFRCAYLMCTPILHLARTITISFFFIKRFNFSSKWVFIFHFKRPYKKTQYIFGEIFLKRYYVNITGRVVSLHSRSMSTGCICSIRFIIATLGAAWFDLRCTTSLIVIRSPKGNQDNSPPWQVAPSKTKDDSPPNTGQLATTQDSYPPT